MCNPPPPPVDDEEDVFNFQPTNIFTPNSDGTNDLLVFCDGCNIKGEVVILNRWGNVVFETNDITIPWDGNNKSGQPVVDGTYYYHIEVQYKNRAERSEKVDSSRLCTKSVMA